MTIHLSEVPFSCRGSYLAVSELTERSEKGMSKKICLRTIHGISYLPGRERIIEKTSIARIQPLYNGEEIPYTTEAEAHELRLVTEYGTVSLCYGDDDTILLRGEGENLGLRFNFENGGYLYHTSADEKEAHCVCARLGCRFRIGMLKGRFAITQEWNATVAESCFADVTPDENGFLLAFRNMPLENDSPLFCYDYDTCKEKAREDFEDFLNKMPAVSERYASERALAAYILWSGIVKPDGILKRDSMLMSKNWMCNVWSWDHCFNAIALSYHAPELAWEQFMVMFDFQQETGVIPDCVNNVYASYAFVKPPIHGWALSRMMENMALREEQLSDAYDKLSRWTNWWLNCRDHDRDGLCEYFHGNDSGWDNSTAFAEGPAVELPDLAAFLVIQMKTLSRVAALLGYEKEADEWEKKAETMLEKMLSVFFEGGKPSARLAYTHKSVENDSLILYLPVLLGELLPKEVAENLVKTLKSEKFYTEHGFATEAPNSTHYLPDGYWRGPIWAPSSILILDGLYKLGEKELVKEAAGRFAEMASQSGFAENYDALTGEGLRDRAYTWTASVFLTIAHDYLSE